MNEKLKADIEKFKARLRVLRRPLRKMLRPLRYLHPKRYLTRLDRYIIAKFIGTYIYSIILIISISIVFDVNENLAKFYRRHLLHVQTGW